MIIEVIDDLETFARLKGNWDAVYDADPEAQFFLSWDWLSQWIGHLNGPWFVLAAKANAAASQYVAFFPLKLKTKERAAGVGFYDEISMVGNYAADYTGFICSPEHQDNAIPAFAQHLKRMNWAQLRLEYLSASNRRVELFLRAFPGKNFVTREIAKINKTDNIDNCICPAVSLPNDWDAYLNERLSTNSRQKARRFLRQLDNSSELRITHATTDTIERDLKILIEYWAAQWGARKGNRLQSIVNMNYSMLRRCAERGLLFLPVLWKNDTPLGALASFIDPRKKSLLFYLGGRNESFNNPPPGFLLHAYSIRYAIGAGIVTYDFLRGNEAYKYSFGAAERRIKCLILSTKDDKNLGHKLDPRSVPLVFKRAMELHKSGKLTQAEQAYRQVLATSPSDALALYCYAQLLESKDAYAAASKAFRSLVKVQPHSVKARLGLARNLAMSGKHSDAAGVYREVVKRQPDFAAARCSLAGVLYKTNELDEALDELRSALKLTPENEKAQSLWCSAIAAAATRSPDKRGSYAAMGSSLADAMKATGQAGFAIRCYRQALDLQPELAAAQLGLQQALSAHADSAGPERRASALASAPASSPAN